VYLLGGQVPLHTLHERQGDRTQEKRWTTSPAQQVATEQTTAIPLSQPLASKTTCLGAVGIRRLLRQARLQAVLRTLHPDWVMH